MYRYLGEGIRIQVELLGAGLQGRLLSLPLRGQNSLNLEEEFFMLLMTLEQYCGAAPLAASFGDSGSSSGYCYKSIKFPQKM